MKKLTALILALLMMSFVSCSSGETDAPATDAPATNAPVVEVPETEAPETEAPATEAPETEAPIEVEDVPELPVQTDVPCNFKEALDLSGDIFYPEFVLNDTSGQWILGDDNAQMSNVLTKELLEEYEYFAITYTTDYCEPTNELALMFKYVHEDGTKTEYLCHEWQHFGPAGMTFEASSFHKMPVYGEGVFYFPTELFLTNANYVEGDIINQIGFAAVEETYTTVALTITGAYLTK